MEKFDSYKDSGVQWIGEIPSDWNISKFKFVFREKKSVKNPSLSSGSISFGEVIYKDDDKIPESTKESYQELLKGEFLINPLNLNYDLKSLRIGKSEIDVVVSQGYIILKILSGNDPDYFKYLLREFDVRHMKSLGQGIRQTISFTNLSNEKLLIPPFPEQHQIVSFLDTKTSLIDSLIEKTQRKIELLKEQRTSLINEVVTKGLNPDVEMKDSGVEWIGEIPSHWGISKVKYEFYKKGGGTPSKEIEEYWGGSIPWVSPKDMKSVWISDSIDKITENGLKNSTTNLITEYSLLMVVRSGILQHTIPVGMNTVSVTINQDLKSFSSKNGTRVNYLYYLIKGHEGNLLLEWSKEGTTVESIEMEFLENSYLPIPSYSEQLQIVKYLDSETQLIDKTLSNEEKRIELLKEYRQSLISEVVTGKIKVPGV